MRATIDFPGDLKDRLEHRARMNHRSLSGEVAHIVETYLRLESRTDVEIFKALASCPPAG